VTPSILPGYDFMEAIDQRSTQSAYWRPAAAEGRPLPTYGTSGTGGIESVDFYLYRAGYRAFVVVKGLRHAPPTPFAPYAELMEQVKTGFGRTMTRLPEIFGVSRQTLYNWMAGETPKSAHQPKIEQLAAAARVFSQLGIKPTSDLLDRVVSHGKSFLQLLADGSDGADTAAKLVRIAKRGSDSRSRLDAILNSRKPERPDVSDMGSPSLEEDV
jgi:transcriptional regulator with XRE-family HTH domain